ncbi:MAG TPA: Fic family protein [Solirubrobacterales bacterium]|nr:Fic family protein [Solirubrobacterales bacterium]
MDELFHLERLRLGLDSPKGYGLRLEFLRKPMSVEEQISFFSTLHEDLMRQLLADRRLEDKVDTMIVRTTLIAEALGISDQPSSLESPDVIGATDASMSDISVATLQLLHRAVTEGASLPDAVRGTLRSVRLWVGDPNDPVYAPPEPEEVPGQLAELLAWWRESYSIARKAGLPAVVPALARLHYGIVAIHPFVDGNGRLARFVTDQASRELLGRGISEEITSDRRLYFEALKAGNDGDLGPLQGLIRAALT